MAKKDSLGQDKYPHSTYDPTEPGGCAKGLAIVIFWPIYGILWLISGGKMDE